MNPAVAPDPVSGLFRTLQRRAEQMAQTLDRQTVLLPVFAALVYAGAVVAKANHRLWHDELYTFYIATSATMREFWAGVLHVDLNPPLNYLFTRWSIALFGPTEFATRVPVMLGFLLGSGCLYVFVKRRLSPLYGLFAVLCFWSTPLFDYATEARPYGLLTGFLGIAMVAWQSAISRTDRRRDVLLLGFAIACMLMTHIFGVFCLIPFGLAELWRWYRLRRPDYAIWAALIIPLVLIPIYLPLVGQYTTGNSFPDIFRASPVKVAGFYARMIAPATPYVFLAMVVAMVAAFRPKQETDETKPLPIPESIFAAGLLLMPVFVVTGMMLIHGAFFHRYGLPAGFAFAVIPVFLIGAYTGLSRLAAASACTVLVLCFLGARLVAPVLLEERSKAQESSAKKTVDQIRPELPFVAASGLTFVEMNKYESPAFLARVYYLVDKDLAMKYGHATIFNGLGMIKQRFGFRGNVESYYNFVASYPHFIVFGEEDYPEDWVLQKARDDGAEVTLLDRLKAPYKDQEIYEVKMPSAQMDAPHAAW